MDVFISKSGLLCVDYHHIALLCSFWPNVERSDRNIFAGMFNWACFVFRHVYLLASSPCFMFRHVYSFGMFWHV